MALYNFHRVLISSSILFFFGFALYAFRRYGQLDGQAGELAMGIGSLLVSGLAVGYLIYFNYTLHTKIQPQPNGA